MKIAFLTFDFGEYSVRLASALSAHGKVLLLAPEHLTAPYLTMLDPAVRMRLFRKPRLRQAGAQVKTMAAIHRTLRLFQPDVLHVQAGHAWFNLSLPLLPRCPVVLTVHDSRRHPGDGVYYPPQWIMDFGMRRATRLIAHASQVKEELAARLRLERQRIQVIPHISVGDQHAQQHVAEEEGTVLFFGRIWPYKGLDFLIRAEPLISREVGNAKFVIAGEGEDFDRYARMMVHPDRFVVHNAFVPDEQRAELFRRASVVVLPYVEASQSGVVPVAYTYLKPVVATTVGGLPDSVEHGATGLLVPPADEGSLAQAIVRLLRDRGLRRRLGANGHRKLQTEWAPPAVAAATFRVYEEARAAFREAA